MTIRYKFGPDYIPVAVECPEVGYRRLDADGAVQYENTHFDTIEEAWAAGQREIQARLRLVGGDVEQAQRALRRFERHAADATAAYSRFCAARREYESEHGPGDAG